MDLDTLMPPVVGVAVIPVAAGLVAFVAGRNTGRYLASVAAVAVLFLLTRASVDVLGNGPERHVVGGWATPLGIELVMDGLATVMLIMTAAVFVGVLVYAWDFAPSATADTNPAGDAFWPLLMVAWGALNALFVSGDLFNLYVTLELLTITSAAMIGLARTHVAVRAALNYLLAALAGSLLYLLGLSLVYAQFGTVDLTTLAAIVTRGPSTSGGLALMTAGLAVKTALVPLHFWLPPAHANAPAPVSAILSAVAVKGSFYIAFRLWLTLGGVLDIAAGGRVLAGLGAAAILYGSWQALRQRRLKLLIAYSTVAQVGYLFVPFGLLLDLHGADLARRGIAYFALAHAFAKAAMFLAAGNIVYALGSDEINGLQGTARRLPVSVFAFGLAGASIIGLPPSGGFIGKWLMLNAALAAEQWWLVGLILVGGLLAAAYVFKVLGRTLGSATPALVVDRVPWRMEWSALGLALAAIVLGVTATRAIRLLEADVMLAPGVGAVP